MVIGVWGCTSARPKEGTRIRAATPASQFHCDYPLNLQSGFQISCCTLIEAFFIINPSSDTLHMWYNCHFLPPLPEQILPFSFDISHPNSKHNCVLINHVNSLLQSRVEPNLHPY